MKNINLTAPFFVAGFCITLFGAFYFFPTPSVAVKNKPNATNKIIDVNSTNEMDTIYLVVWTEEGRVESVFTKRENAEKYIEKTDNEMIYEVRSLNYFKVND
jgi:hypothetical protein